MEAVLVGLGIVGFFAFLWLIFWIARQIYYGAVRELHAFGDSLTDVTVEVDDGWFPSLSSTHLSGRLDGHEIHLGFRAESRGKTSVVYSLFSMRVPNAVAGFEVKKAGVLNRFGRWLGVVSDVKTGNEAVDDKYILAGQEGSLRKLFQNPDLESSIDSLFGHRFSSVELNDGWLQCEHVGDRNAATYEGAFRALARIAEQCERTPVKVRILGETSHFALTLGTSSAHCPFCRDDVGLDGDDVMACPGCDTVHHAACYDEAGGCTIFGCSRQARRGVSA